MSGCLEASRIDFQTSSSWRQRMKRFISIARKEESFWWASPVQVYLELMGGDKRDQETAEQLKTSILNDVGPVRP